MRVLIAADPDLGGRLEILLKAAGAETELVTSSTAAVSRLKSFDGIALIDHDFNGLRGTRAVQKARSLLGDRPLGVLHDIAAPAMAHRALSAGATGVLPHDLDPDGMRAALALLVKGARFAIFCGAVQFAPLEAATTLTDRELQVLHGVCDGLQNKEIAHRFGISIVTVKMHMRAVIKKLGARNRTHAAMIARDMNIV